MSSARAGKTYILVVAGLCLVAFLTTMRPKLQTPLAQASMTAEKFMSFAGKATSSAVSNTSSATTTTTTTTPEQLQLAAREEFRREADEIEERQQQQAGRNRTSSSSSPFSATTTAAATSGAAAAAASSSAVERRIKDSNSEGGKGSGDSINDNGGKQRRWKRREGDRRRCPATIPPGTRSKSIDDFLNVKMEAFRQYLAALSDIDNTSSGNNNNSSGSGNEVNLVVTFVDATYVDVAEVWYYHYRKNKPNCGVVLCMVAVDDAAYEAAVDRFGGNASETDDLFILQAPPNWERRYRKLWVLRVDFLHAVRRSYPGWNVLFSDVDAVWQDDPFETLFEPLAGRRRGDGNGGGGGGADVIASGGSKLTNRKLQTR